MPSKEDQQVVDNALLGQSAQFILHVPAYAGGHNEDSNHARLNNGRNTAADLCSLDNPMIKRA